MKIKLLILFTLFFSISQAKDYYWIGGSGNWDDSSHWSITSGGESSKQVPKTSDNAIFDDNSFTIDNSTVNFNSVEINSVHYKSKFNSTFEGQKLTVNSFINLESYAHFNSNIYLSNKVNENGYLNTGGFKQNSNFYFTGGNWEIKNHLITGDEDKIEINSKSFNSNSNSILSGDFVANVKALNLSNTSIFVFNKIDFSNSKKVGTLPTLFLQNSEDIDLGNFNKSDTRDQTVNCTGGLTLDLAITQDYNGRNVSCNGECDGELTITTAGSPGPFSYSINSGAFTTTTVYSGLCADFYTIVVTDSSQVLAPGIFAQCSTTPEQINPTPQITFLPLSGGVPIQPTCPGVCDGQAFTGAVGGTGLLTSTWTGSGEITENPVGLCGGFNTVIIEDVNGCTITDDIFISEPAEITFDVTITPPTCNGDNDAEIFISNEGGGNGGPWTYSFAPVPGNGQGSNPATDYGAGAVTISVFDAGAGGGAPLCQQDSLIQIIDPPVLSISAINPLDISCFGLCDGTITALPSGGVPPYTFEWFDNITMASTGFTDSITNTFCTGEYFVVVTDAGGCEATSAAQNLDQPTEIDATASATAISCFGVCDGTVSVSAIGGSPGYGFTWTTVPGDAGVGAANNLTGLCPGEYKVVVNDLNGCLSEADTVEVDDVLPVTLNLTSNDPTCYNICNGDITANAGGGVGGFTYVWTPAPPVGQGTPTISSLCGDIQYDVHVEDLNGCFLEDDLTLNNPPQYDITSNKTDLSCFGDTDGTISLNVNSGGDGGPYTITWAPGNPIGQGTNSVSGLSAGNYTATIGDALGCDTVLNFAINSPAQLTVNASVISHVNCFEACDGSAQVTINGGVPNYVITWSDPSSQSALVANGLCEGNYTINVTDDNSCSGSDNITITQPDQYDITIGQTDLDCFGDCDATTTVTINSGGTPNYTILWDDPLNQNTFTATNLCAGTYIATVSDAKSCDSLITFTIDDPDELTLLVNVSSSACFGSCSGEVTLTPNGGTGLITYEWFEAITNVPLGVNNTTITGLCPGDYYATATDFNGCTTTTPVFSIVELPQINTSLISSTPASCGICDAQAEVSASGGAGGFTYTWSPAPTISGQGTPVADGLCGGVYNVNIEDANGCIGSQSVVINSVALEILDLDSVDVSCFGVCDGETSVTFACLEPPCIVEWFNNANGISTGQFGNSTTNLCAGEYLAVLSNNLGCVKADTIVINTPPEIVVSVTPTAIDCFNSCDGSAIATASGGEGALTLLWSPLPGSGQNSLTAGGLCAGNWDFTVEDQSSCSVTVPFVIGEPDELVIDNESATDVSCFGSSDGTTTVLASGGTGALSVEWFICGTNVSAGLGALNTGLAPGDYFPVVTDANDCQVTGSCVTVNDQDELTAIIQQDNITCFGECNGRLEVTPGGGNGIYSYQWLDENLDPIAGQTNPIFNNICQGIYSLQLTDGNNCSITEGPFDMTQPTNPWDVSSSSTDISCNNVCDGEASVTVNTGNTPPYTYLWNDPFAQTTPTATGLCAGNYVVTITDAGVCDTTISFTINDIPPFNLSGTQTNVNCITECTGMAEVNPNGGTAPYDITWSDAQIGNTAIGLCAGDIIATITDDSGCTIDTTFTITEPLVALTVNSVFNNEATCGVCNGSATVNVVGGTPNYNFTWSGPFTGQGTNTVTNLCTGIISVDIEDANGCTITEVISIQDVNGEDLTVNTNDASCFGVCDGDAEVTFVCSDPGCTQEWFNATTGISTGITVATISSLCADDYIIQVTNNSGCVSSENLTIDSPSEILANESITEITCAGDSDASIILAPSGGSGAGYTYSWNPLPPNGDGTNIASPIGPGIWSVEITDGDGCFSNLDYNLLDTIPIEITTSLNDASCTNSCDGNISTNVTGGYGSYTYQWFMNGVLMPGETNFNVTGLCQGNYNVEVTDLNGCVQTLVNDLTISEPFSVASTITSTDVVCFGQCNGTATVSPSGGTSPYIINWYNGVGTLLNQHSLVINNLCPDDYHTEITDNNGCTFVTADVTIIEPTELTFTLNSNDASCFDVCDGDGELLLVGGELPYQYEWLNVFGDPIPGGTNSNVSNLCAGNYMVEGLDDNGCSTTPQNVVIDQFDEITANLFSNDANCGIADGNASVFANGGDPPYTYQWLDNTQIPIGGATNSTILNVFAGTYYVDVSDFNGCTNRFQVNVSDVPTTQITWDAINHPTCFNNIDGSIEATVTGLSLPLQFIWNPGGMITEDIDNLAAGDYTLQVTDALGCINFYDTTLINPNDIIVNSNTTNTDCNQCNGEIAVTVSGGTGTLSTSWNNGLTGLNLNGLCASVYEITVTDLNGCISVEQITVDNNAGLTTDATITAISCPNVCDGEITVTGVDGTPPYTYNWLNFPSTNTTESNLCADTYFIEITDAAGCSSPLEIELLEPSNIIVTETVIPPGCGLSDGSISVITSGGSLPHSYLWSTTDITPTISNLNADIYTLNVTNGSGCSEDFTFGLNNSTAPEVSLSSTDLICRGDCIGEITSTVSGGTPIYTYQWFDELGVPIPLETNPTLTGLCEGQYFIEVTDAAGCKIFDNTTINQPDTILLNTPFNTDPTCNGICDGNIIVNPIGGTQPFTYTWDDSETQTSLNPTDLCAGIYNVVITDANGCIANQSSELFEPLPITIVLDSIIGATCLNSEDGAIYISASGGTGTIGYQWVSQFNDTTYLEDIINVLPLEYYVTATDENGCFSQDTFAIDTNLVVLSFAGNDTTLCFDFGVTLNGQSNQSDVDYTWYDINGIEISDTSELILNPQTPGTVSYILMVNLAGCDDMDTINVTTNPQIIVDAGPDIEMFSIETEVIGGTPTTDLTISEIDWSPSIYLSDSTTSNPSVVKPNEDTYYYVTVTDTLGCQNIDSIYVEVIPSLIVPDGISPNGDGKNETWQLVFKEDFPDMEVSVYNRWGELLFYDNNGYANEWDGKFNGEELPVGTYYYVIDVHHPLYPDPFTGPITVMR
jgi:gliding motility-associated-like protein